MPPKRRKSKPKKRAPKTPVIDRLKDQGLDRWEILDRMNGPGDGKTQFSRAQYEAMGFNDWRVDRFASGGGAWQQPRGGAPSGGGNSGGGSGGSGAPPQPDPQADFFDWQRQQMEREAARQDAARRESAFSIMSGLLDQYGLGTLSGYIQGLIQDGITDPASLQLRLQETTEWKQRFRGNELLKAQGLGVLSPAEYLNLESSYAEVLRRFGMPPGFFDTREAFADFIGNNVSPQELAERTQAAMDLTNQVDPTQRETLRSMYGIGEGDIAAYFLDPKKAQPILQKQVQAVKVASAGKRAGLAVGNDRARFEDMVDRGVNEQMAAQGYGRIANEIDPLRNLASIWGRGDDWTLEEAEDATFFNDAEAQRERRGLIQQERAAFSGASGFRAGVSGRRSSAGQF